jgi:DNA-binding transcriptional LysR family regulator
MIVDEISSWEAFQMVALHGNFTKAAAKLGLSVSQLSKRVAGLEEQLNVRLFTRSTRLVALTDEGRSILPKVTSFLEDYANLESSFESEKHLSGTIRITSVPFVAHRLLLGVFEAFAKAYPLIHIELELSEKLVNLVESNMDMAIRIHDKPEDSSLVYRKLAANDLVLCASPHYLKSIKKPLKKPADLKEHQLLMLKVHEKCRFKHDGIRMGELLKLKRFSAGAN